MFYVVGFMQGFKKLEIWRLSKELTIMIYKVTEKYPSTEKFGLVNQMRRAAISIPANIAEGTGRSSNKDLANFINISIGSLFELETFTEISKELNFIDANLHDAISKKIAEIKHKAINFNKRVRT
jgi:four helix bundle protein